MIFGRSKARNENSAARSLENETLARWQNIAAQTVHRTAAEFSHSEPLAAWPSAVSNRTSGRQTITLTEVAAERETSPVDYEEAPPLREQMQIEMLADDQREEKQQPVPPSDLSLNVEEDLKRRFGANIQSALGPGTVIEGTFRFDNPVCIDGTMLGEVTSTSVLIVGEQATVKAKVKVGSLIVLGQVTGEIEAAELIEIRAGGRLDGDILTKRLAIEDGGYYQGNCNTLD